MREFFAPFVQKTEQNNRKKAYREYTSVAGADDDVKIRRIFNVADNHGTRGKNKIRERNIPETPSLGQKLLPLCVAQYVLSAYGEREVAQRAAKTVVKGFRTIGSFGHITWSHRPSITLLSFLP